MPPCEHGSDSGDVRGKWKLLLGVQRGGAVYTGPAYLNASTPGTMLTAANPGGRGTALGSLAGSANFISAATSSVAIRSLALAVPVTFPGAGALPVAGTGVCAISGETRPKGKMPQDNTQG